MRRRGDIEDNEKEKKYIFFDKIIFLPRSQYTVVMIVAICISMKFSPLKTMAKKAKWPNWWNDSNRQISAIRKLADPCKVLKFGIM
jgi:hypothetical protein